MVTKRNDGSGGGEVAGGVGVIEILLRLPSKSVIRFKRVFVMEPTFFPLTMNSSAGPGAAGLGSNQSFPGISCTHAVEGILWVHSVHGVWHSLLDLCKKAIADLLNFGTNPKYLVLHAEEDDVLYNCTATICEHLLAG
ncbi:hypothetical protein FEM48_Zijuj05G0162800 [Ziziphus jujuba var. spinosa]|uniref:Uncharacterized protein n=1 Tax=Ziziphus jujuba var. spinosa TaxID=714518 RepID=A0A978VFU3_ZIZJJ|nr:hypothetical protein FEM48_Zijuj05G0162800 [Ziziphus jujuba var. spinosa]